MEVEVGAKTRRALVEAAPSRLEVEAGLELLEGVVGVAVRLDGVATH